MEAGYTIYELFETLIMRVGWQNQAEQVAALESVKRWKESNLFGNMVQLIACDHLNVLRRYNASALCQDCGRIVE